MHTSISWVFQGRWNVHGEDRMSQKFQKKLGQVVSEYQRECTKRLRDEEGNMREFRITASADTRLHYHYCSIACIESRQKKKSSIIQDIAQHIYQLSYSVEEILLDTYSSAKLSFFLMKKNGETEKEKKSFECSLCLLSGRKKSKMYLIDHPCKSSRLMRYAWGNHEKCSCILWKRGLLDACLDEGFV